MEEMVTVKSEKGTVTKVPKSAWENVWKEHGGYTLVADVEETEQVDSPAPRAARGRAQQVEADQ